MKRYVEGKIADIRDNAIRDDTRDGASPQAQTDPGERRIGGVLADDVGDGQVALPTLPIRCGLAASTPSVRMVRTGLSA